MGIWKGCHAGFQAQGRMISKAYGAGFLCKGADLLLEALKLPGCLAGSFLLLLSLLFPCLCAGPMSPGASGSGMDSCGLCQARLGTGNSCARSPSWAAWSTASCAQGEQASGGQAEAGRGGGGHGHLEAADAPISWPGGRAASLPWCLPVLCISSAGPLPLPLALWTLPGHSVCRLCGDQAGRQQGSVPLCGPGSLPFFFCPRATLLLLFPGCVRILGTPCALAWFPGHSLAPVGLSFHTWKPHICGVLPQG